MDSAKEIVDYLVISATLGFINYGIIKVIDFCFNDGNIFDWYYRWLLTIPKKIAKPLGLCLKCMGFWVNLIIFVVIKYRIFDIPLYYFIVSYLIIFAILTIDENKKH